MAGEAATVKLYRNGYEAMRDYLAGMQAASAPRSQDPYAMRGKVYVDACITCGGTRWKVKGLGVEICAGLKRNGRRCERPRDWVPGAVPAGFFDTNPRPGATSDDLEKLVTLGVIIKRAGLWPRRVFTLYVIHGSYDQVKSLGRSWWPRREDGWSEWGIKRDARIARERIEAGLSRARWLRDSDLVA